MTKLHKHQSSVSSSSSFSSGENDNSDAFDPHDVNFPGGVRSYEQSVLLNRPDSSLLPPGLTHDNYDEVNAFAEKVPLTIGENFSYPSRCALNIALGIKW